MVVSSDQFSSCPGFHALTTLTPVFRKSRVFRVTKAILYCVAGGPIENRLAIRSRKRATRGSGWGRIISEMTFVSRSHDTGGHSPSRNLSGLYP